MKRLILLLLLVAVAGAKPATQKVSNPDGSKFTLPSNFSSVVRSANEKTRFEHLYQDQEKAWTIKVCYAAHSKEMSADEAKTLYERRLKAVDRSLYEVKEYKSGKDVVGVYRTALKSKNEADPGQVYHLYTRRRTYEISSMPGGGKPLHDVLEKVYKSFKVAK